jgi:hypothetical protein
MFDLKNEINKWRRALSETQMCNRSDLDELESHLKDEMDQLRSQGLSEEEAFLVGTHRLGQPDALAGEFAKVNESLWLRTKCFWGGYALFAYIAANYAAETLSKFLLWLATLLGLRGYAAGIFDPVSRTAIFLLIIFLWCVLARRRDPNAEYFSKTADSLKGKVALLTMASLLMLALLAARTVLSAAIIHTVGIQDIGRITMPTAILMRSGWLIEPVVMMMVLIYLRPTMCRKLA